MNEFEYIECACSSAEHTIRFYKDTEEDDYIVMEVHLRHYHSLPQRAWRALKYMLGYQCRYGMYDCTLIGQKEAKKLIKLLKRTANGSKTQI